MVEENQTQEPEFKQIDTFVIADLETLKAMTDPMRLQILETLINKPRTVKEIAKILNTSPTRLYYHINQLETYKLIQVVSTRIVSGVIEKSYQAAAKNFTIAHGLLSLKDEAGNVDEKIEALLSSILSKTHTDILNSVKAGLIDFGDDDTYAKANTRLGSMTVRLKPEQIEAFLKKFDELIHEFNNMENSEETENLMDYSFLVALYPTQNSSEASE